MLKILFSYVQFWYIALMYIFPQNGSLLIHKDIEIIICKVP